MHVGKSREQAVVFVYGLSRGNWSDYPLTQGVPFFLTGDYDSLVLVLQ